MDSIYNMDHMRILGTEHSSVSRTSSFWKIKKWCPKSAKQADAKGMM